MKQPWVRFEEWLARRFHGQRTPGSGNVWWSKEDVRGERVIAVWSSGETQQVLIQAKTAKKAATIHKEDIEKLVRHAVAQNRTPLLAINIGDFVIVGEVEVL